MNSGDDVALKRNSWWIRDPRNPVLPPGSPGSFDSTCCMNPCVLRIGGEYHLYYAGGDDGGRKRICLAVAPVGDPAHWERLGPVVDIGPPGSFDAHWCVLPNVVQLAPDRWHLYYSGNTGVGSGLSAFPGIGLAVSSDGRHWEKYPDNPILPPTGQEGDPDAVGIGGGSVLKACLADGSSEWRMYYTACPTLGDDLFLNQQKRAALATSQDGIHWQRRGAVMLRDPDRDYENVAVATPVVHQNQDGSYRMWFSAIGTRWGAYSLGYAESEDGIHWRRGAHYGDDLQLGPVGASWERQMVEYPTVIREGSRLRLFYCGNGYGAAGIGTATSSPLRATATRGPCLVRIVAAEAGASWDYRIPEGLACDEGMFKAHYHPIVDWYGPDASGMVWHEWRASDADLFTFAEHEMAIEHGFQFVDGVRYRTMITPSAEGLDLRFTVMNESQGTFHNVTMFPCLGYPSADFVDDELERTYIVTAQGLTKLGDTDRGSGDPVRTHYVVDGMRPMSHFAEWFWGLPSRTLAATGAILRTSQDGRFTIGTAWERVCELFNNEDSHHCIHAVPALGDLAPGQTRTARGKIVLVEGGPDEALALLQL